jgi:23S rRNA pseudouridine2457 synthase
MIAAVGFPTLRLIRIAVGPWRLNDLQPGQYQLLSDEQLATSLSGLPDMKNPRRLLQDPPQHGEHPARKHSRRPR